jgi:ubiquinone/menaquinone biosynthesis C-methylase UbiE/uncharacterized metal-binding protein
MENDQLKPGIVLACSGASDLGELVDRIARKIRDTTSVKMKCLAMVSAHDKELITSLQSNETLVIDGCNVDCGKKIMEEAWLSNYRYVRLTDMGYVKGQTKITEELVNELAEKIINSNDLEQVIHTRLVDDECCTEETCDMFDFMSDYVGLKILHPGGTDGTRNLLSQLDIKENMKVLDIACGKGRTSVMLAKKYGCKVVGIDILENSIKEAREYAKKHIVEHLVSFQTANAENLPFADNEFDVTIAQAMLILVNDKAKVVHEASRVLKSDGTSGWIELSWKKTSEDDFIKAASQEICAKCITNVVTFDDWEKLLKGSGYSTVSTSRFNMEFRGFSKMLKDEGIINGMNVMFRYLTKSKIRSRMDKLSNFFKTYPEFLGYGIFITKK